MQTKNLGEIVRILSREKITHRVYVHKYNTVSISSEMGFLKLCCVSVTYIAHVIPQ